MPVRRRHFSMLMFLTCFVCSMPSINPRPGQGQFPVSNSLKDRPLSLWTQSILLLFCDLYRYIRLPVKCSVTSYATLFILFLNIASSSFLASHKLSSTVFYISYHGRRRCSTSTSRASSCPSRLPHRSRCGAEGQRSQLALWQSSRLLQDPQSLRRE